MEAQVTVEDVRKNLKDRLSKLEDASKEELIVKDVYENIRAEILKDL
jgi:hypothetical protein